MRSGMQRAVHEQNRAWVCEVVPNSELRLNFHIHVHKVAVDDDDDDDADDDAAAAAGVMGGAPALAAKLPMPACAVVHLSGRRLHCQWPWLVCLWDAAPPAARRCSAF